MRLHALALLVHILGVIAMFAGFAMLQRAGARVRRATTHAEARPWAELLTMGRPMPPSGAVMVLLSGAYLSTRFAGPRPPAWIVAPALAAAFIGALALAVVNRDIGAIAASVAAGDGPLSSDAAARVGRARTWSALAAANGAALGALWVMTMKPGPLESAVAALLPIVVGALVGARLGRNS
jgi:hypothetical protein